MRPSITGAVANRAGWTPVAEGVAGCPHAGAVHASDNRTIDRRPGFMIELCRPAGGGNAPRTATVTGHATATIGGGRSTERALSDLRAG